MKSYPKFPLLIIIVLLSFLLLLAFQVAKQRLTPQNQTAPEISAGLPVRLTIPAIAVTADIQAVGVTADGEMAVPSNPADTGWFQFGSRPGEKGSAVITGHIDGTSGEAGVFINLYQLKPGDELFVENDQGITSRFIVRESRSYDPGYAEEVFSANDRAHLNLITCDGVWDGDQKSYTKRLVVFADLAD